MNKLEFYIPFIPPSVNKMYSSVKIKGVMRRILSKEADKFQKDFFDFVSREYFLELSDFNPNPLSVFSFTYITYFPDIKTKTKGAKHPYKRKDARAGSKLAEDALADVLGVDDLYNFDLHIKKRLGELAIKIIYEEMSFDDLEE